MRARFSTAGPSSRPASVATRPLWFLQRVVRVVRVGALAAGIYAAGLSAGQMEVLQDPEAMRQKLQQLYVVRSHTHEGDRGELAEPVVYHETSALYRRVAGIGARILVAAREHVGAKRAASLGKLRAVERELEALAEPGWHAASAARLQLESECVAMRKEVEYWEDAAKRLNGHWTWVVTNSTAINAFVTPLCPRTVFVLEGLLVKLRPTDDELAMVIAHELSHHIHQHGTLSMEYGAELAALQLLVLACIDPSGLVEVAVSAGLFYYDFLSTRTFSRSCEHEADETGLDIVARACFDTRAAAHMMGKFAEIPELGGSAHNSWASTHPLVSSRLELLLAQSSRLERTHASTYRELCERELHTLREAFRASRTE